MSIEVADEICSLFAARGSSSYFGEPVSQLEHALQAALFAEEENAPDHLVVAALVHDIGHLVHGMDEQVADRGVDARHEEAGESWLKERFGPEVYEPVRLHVAAKRYLCAANSDYLGTLSPASVQSLQLQGGPMTGRELEEFRAIPSYQDALRLRLWDDRAKIPGLPTPNLESYRGRIVRLCN